MRLGLFGLLVAGCQGAVTLDIASDRPIPQALDSICVGVADTAASGGHFGRDYALGQKITSLPQSLRVEPGSASSALAWVRGDRGGVPVQLAEAPIDFGGDVTLPLDRCTPGSATLPHAVGAAVGPASPLLAASQGQGGAAIVAVGAAGTAFVFADGSALVAREAPAAPAGNPIAVVTADLDGDCDDDAIVATDGAPPEIWRRDGATLVDAGPIGTAAVAAIATADVDRDGDTDVILAAGGTLELWRNDGGGNFTQDAAALSGGGRITAASALALGDLDGDGNPDLVVGQAGGGLEAWLGDPGGTGSFVPADAVIPAVPLDVEQLVLVDADGDFDPDLAVAVTGAPMRLYIDRDGLLEDQSFVRLPQPPPAIHAIAIGNWDDGCEPDAVVATDAGNATWRGQPTDMFAAEQSTAPASTGVVMIDLDADGILDAVFATAQGAQWLAR